MHVSIIQRLCAFTVTLLLPWLACAATSPSVHGEMDVERFADLTRSTYSLQDFSERYRATLEIAAGDEVFRPGIIRVYNQQTGAELIRVQSGELVLDIDAASGKVKANVRELPYGEQSVLIYDDFNFDGIKDLALMDGQFSCYHGPSFQVFLGTGDGFKHSEPLSALAQDYCGMFGYDAANRRISTTTKDGCCTHWFTTWSVHDGQPVMDSETLLDQTSASGLARETRTLNRNGKRISTERMLWAEDDLRQILLAFSLAPSGKRIIVFRSDINEGVYYSAVDSKGQVGLLYPEAEGEALEYDRIRKSLNFVRGDTSYRIQANEQGVPTSMEVVMGGKTIGLNLLPGPVTGSLDRVGAALQARQ